MQHAQALAVLGDLLPVPLHIIQVAGEVGEAPLKHLAIQRGAYDGLEVDVLGLGTLGPLEDVVGGTLDGLHEGVYLVRVCSNELLVSNVQDRIEAAVAKLGELVDIQYLYICLRTALVRELLLELNHLNVLEANASVDAALYNSLGHVYAVADGCVVREQHTVVRGQLVNLDLAELADVADALALKRTEVGRNARGLEIHYTGKGLV